MPDEMLPTSRLLPPLLAEAALVWVFASFPDVQSLRLKHSFKYKKPVSSLEGYRALLKGSGLSLSLQVLVKRAVYSQIGLDLTPTLVASLLVLSC